MYSEVFYLSLIVLYILSLAYVVVKLVKYKRPVRQWGGFDYGYLEEQSFHTRAALTVAINTSIISMILSISDMVPSYFLLIFGVICLLVALFLLK